MSSTEDPVDSHATQNQLKSPNQDAVLENNSNETTPNIIVSESDDKSKAEEFKNQGNEFLKSK